MPQAFFLFRFRRVNCNSTDARGCKVANRVNWGAIFAGSLTGMGASLVLAYMTRAFASLVQATPPPGGAISVPVSGNDAILAVFVAALAFGTGGAVTTLLGRFPRISTALLHSFTALAISYLFTHFFLRDAFFVGRAGYPFDQTFVSMNAGINIPAAVSLPISALASWTTCFASLAGIGSSGFATWKIYNLRLRKMTSWQEEQPRSVA